MCGEQSSFSSAPWTLAGSSPRVRGTVDVPALPVYNFRFIPACAGNSVAQSDFAGLEPGSSPRVRGTANRSQSASCSATVHPRVCGEQGSGVSSAFSCSGSSPRVRGTGKQARSGHGNLAVHPRVCGEQSLLVAFFGNSVGSSPRVRGTVSARALRLSLRRFIPACAGNRRTRSNGANRGSVHPRVCGEQFVDAGILKGRTGSSPRVRGTGCPQSVGRSDRRFIPACAGNRFRSANSVVTIAVHPRVCGEQTVGPAL